jgi:hypothetical protein
MSQAVQQQSLSDPVLSDPEMGLKIFPNDLTVDPKFGNIKLILPVARIGYCTLVEPKAIKQDDGSMGRENRTATFLFNPLACDQLYDGIVNVARWRFPPEIRPDVNNPSAMVEVSAEELLRIPRERGGLQFPLRAGMDNYMKDPKRFEIWKDLLFINTSMSARDSNGNPQEPAYFDEYGQQCGATKFYPGCYVVPKIVIFSFPKPGAQAKARGVGIGLDTIWFVQHGEKLNFFNRAAASAAELQAKGIVIPRRGGAGVPQGMHPQQAYTPGQHQPTQQGGEIGYGPNAATPAAVPPGRWSTQQQPAQPVQQPAYQAPSQVAGFAAPPPPPQQPAMQQTAAAAPPPPPEPVWNAQTGQWDWVFPGQAAPPAAAPPQSGPTGYIPPGQQPYIPPRPGGR